MTRITRAFGTVTSIFRCHGLQHLPPGVDRVGGHDLFYWCGFLALMTGWFLFVYAPQCRRVEKLTGRQQALALEFSQDTRSLARLEQGIGDLRQGSALAWERAARVRLGWLQPGETLDASSLLSAAPNNSPRPNSNPDWTQLAQRPDTHLQLPPLPRPRVPKLPRASPPSMLAQSSRGQFADAGSLGPTTSRPPPPPPPLPSLPPRATPRLAPLTAVPQHVVRATQPVTYRTLPRLN